MLQIIITNIYWDPISAIFGTFNMLFIPLFLLYLFYSEYSLDLGDIKCFAKNNMSWVSPTPKCVNLCQVLVRDEWTTSSVTWQALPDTTCHLEPACLDSTSVSIIYEV